MVDGTDVPIYEETTVPEGEDEGMRMFPEEVGSALEVDEGVGEPPPTDPSSSSSSQSSSSPETSSFDPSSSSSQSSSSSSAGDEGAGAGALLGLELETLEEITLLEGRGEATLDDPEGIEET